MNDSIGINFLDFNIQQTVSSNTLKLSLYTKPIYTSYHTYLHAYSNHSIHTFTSFITAELNRILLHSSTFPDCIRAFNNFYNMLLLRDYLPDFLDPLFTSHLAHPSTVINDIEYMIVRENFLNCCLLKKKCQTLPFRKAVLKMPYNVVLPFSKILCTECISWAPDFVSVFGNRNPFIVKFKYKKLGSFIMKNSQDEGLIDI